jgi:hypothetical protein
VLGHRHLVGVLLDDLFVAKHFQHYLERLSVASLPRHQTLDLLEALVREVLVVNPDEERLECSFCRNDGLTVQTDLALAADLLPVGGGRPVMLQRFEVLRLKFAQFIG